MEIDKAWLTPAVLGLVHEIAVSTKGGSSLGPVLADAFLEAGAPEEEVCPCVSPSRGPYEGCLDCRGRGVRPSPLFTHLRRPENHYPFCWVVQQVLALERNR